MAEDQQFYRQYLQSTAPDGSQTVREIVSPNLLDADAAATAEKQAGHTFTGFVSPDKMAGVAPAPTPPAAAPPPRRVVDPAEVVAAEAPWVSRPPVAAPGSSPWLNMIPPALATVGPMALAIAQPELGIPLWIAQAATAGLGMGGGEAIREKLAGEELSPSNIAEQAALGAGTEAGMSTVGIPLAMSVSRGVAGRLPATLGAVEDLGPVLASKDAATAAAPTVSDLAGQSAKVVRSATEPAFNASRVAGQGLPVSTAGLDPHVAAATDAVARAGATPDQVAEFGTVVKPMMSGAPGEYGQLAGRERQLENWVSGMRARGVDPANVAPVEQLHTAVGGQLDAAAAGTPAAPMRAQYVAVQGESLPTRYGLSDLQSNAADLAAPANRPAFQTVVAQASAADRPALAAAWVDSARQAAAQSGNPVGYMRAAYESLGPETQTALFGQQQGAFERVLQTAWGGTTEDVTRLMHSALLPGGVGGGAKLLGVSHVPGYAATVGTLDLMTPFVARGALMQPPVAAFGGNLSRATGVALPAASRLVGQAYAERARQAGLPF